MKRLLFLMCAIILTFSVACAPSTPPTPEQVDPSEGTQASEPSSEKLKIGVSVFDMTDPYFVEIANGVKAAANDLGVDVIVDDPSADAQKQVNALENFMVSGVDGVIVAAVEPESINGLLKEMQEKGVKVIAQNHPVDYYDSIIQIIEFDYGYSCGVVCGEWINEVYPDEEVEVGVIGAGMHTTGIERTKGMIAGLADTSPQAKVVAEQDGEALTDVAMSVTENMLQAHPNIIAIMGYDDQAALGAYEAVKANKTPDEQKMFGVFGLDAVEQAVELIAGGGAYKGTVDIAPHNTGYLALELCVKAIQGEKIPEQVLQEMVYVTAANADDYLD